MKNILFVILITLSLVVPGMAQVISGGGTASTGDVKADGSVPFTGSVTLDDGTTDSPSLIFTDSDDETFTCIKKQGAAGAGYLQCTSAAGDGFQILTGNLKVGNGTPGQTINGEDAYVEGLLEVDGMIYADGGVTGNVTGTASGNLKRDAAALTPGQRVCTDAEDEAYSCGENVTSNAPTSGGPYLLGLDNANPATVRSITLQGLTLTGTTAPILTVTAQTPVIGDADDFDDNFTGANLYGGTYIVNVAGSILLGNSTVGQYFTILLEDAVATVIEPLATGTDDTIVLNGTALTQGHNITSSTKGAMCVFQYRAADSWMATCNGFVDGT